MSTFENIMGEKIISKTPISGGCIGQSFCIKTDAGNLYYLKKYSRSGVSEAEAHGLQEMKKATGVKIPEVITYTESELFLNFIDSRKKCLNFQALLGEQLATLHRVKSDRFGFYENNFIGESVQINRYSNSWADFFVQNRIDSQLKLASRNGHYDTQMKKLSSQLLSQIPRILAGTDEKPTLLHGDLWGGNVMSDENGEPVLIDPALYYGHRESDIAMTTLFGGFDQSFYHSYNRCYPLKPGWEKRLDLYNLYHILNHLNLFGKSYYSQALSLMKKCLKLV